MLIRPEKKEDIDKIRDINIRAFEGETEADIVDALRDSGASIISLVAEYDDELVGHILFSPAFLEGDDQGIRIAGLAPMSVLPEFQRKGIGTKLAVEGLKRCNEAGYDAVVVLGHREYYPRFGFVPSVNFGIRSEYDVPDDVFMAMELNPDALAGCSGVVKYHEVFGKF